MRLDTAWLMGNFVGFALWGIYNTLFFVTMWTVLRRGLHGLGSPVICGAVALYILNLGLTGLLSVTAYEAFITAKGGAAVYFIGRPIYRIVAANNFITFFSMLITDLTLVWHLYIIYMGDVRAFVPVLALLLGAVISGTGTIAYAIVAATQGPLPHYRVRIEFGVATVAFMMIFNWTVTSLIVARLWWADKRMKDSGFLSHHDGVSTKPVTQTYWKVIVVLIESGALYSAFWGVFLITYAMTEAGGNVSLFLTPINARIVGIVPTLIVLQQSLGFIQTSELPVPPTSIVEFAVITTSAVLTADLQSETSTQGDNRARSEEG